METFRGAPSRWRSIGKRFRMQEQSCEGSWKHFRVQKQSGGGRGNVSRCSVKMEEHRETYPGAKTKLREHREIFPDAKTKLRVHREIILCVAPRCKSATYAKWPLNCLFLTSSPIATVMPACLTASLVGLSVFLQLRRGSRQERRVLFFSVQ